VTTSRLEAFSDGVFAVAITFLVFNLKTPVVDHGSLWKALGDEWPFFASYAVSFLVIGIIWVNHHAIFHQIAHLDRPLMFLNLLLLMFVVLIPFSTALLAQYIQAGSNSHAAAAVYSLTMTGMSFAFGFIWAYAVFHPQLLKPHVDHRFARASLPRFTIGSFIYIGTVVVAFISAVLCLAIHAVIALYYVFDRTTGADQFAESPKEIQ
jgi:uncharacterized membrane protein